jgi:hypothetical protein
VILARRWRSSSPGPPAALLWCLEPETDAQGQPHVLIQAQAMPDWKRLNESGWVTHAELGINFVRGSHIRMSVGRKTRC